MDLEKVEKNLRKFDKELPSIVIAFCREFQEEILKMNTDSQLFEKGLLATGSKVVPKYRPSTVKRKKRKGHPYNRVTLKDTGEFHESFELDFGADYFEVVSTDKKGKYLVKRYGKEIYGLTEANVSELRKLLLPLLRAELLKSILL